MFIYDLYASVLKLSASQALDLIKVHCSPLRTSSFGDHLQFLVTPYMTAWSRNNACMHAHNSECKARRSFVDRYAKPFQWNRPRPIQVMSKCPAAAQKLHMSQNKTEIIARAAKNMSLSLLFISSSRHLIKVLKPISSIGYRRGVALMNFPLLQPYC